ncbi:hypothetical protein C8F04DRAFT_1271647 [Mycena alexandri]|uniref:Uncharacterized protein n=1 Tax=Mycena alexandri TaxID=1745969 RepID=A0AAD6S9M9_9AGAR|nr:hypothetical protein C8F04DRAFT_1271647 [Mycena alexandri]
MSLERKIKTRKAGLQHGELYANMDSLLKLYKYGNACTITKVFASQQQDADMEANDDIDQVPALVSVDDDTLGVGPMCNKVRAKFHQTALSKSTTQCLIAHCAPHTSAPTMNPSNPGFSIPTGVMSTDPMRCFPPYGDWDSPPPGTPEMFDHTQHRTYAAVSLRDLRLQLPLVFEHHFERNAHGVWEQKQPLFFAVEGSTQVFKALDAAEQRYYHFHDKNIAIFATATYEEAKARAKK